MSLTSTGCSRFEEIVDGKADARADGTVAMAGDPGGPGDRGGGLAGGEGREDGSRGRPSKTSRGWSSRCADLETTIVAGGDLQATNEATVSCQVEDITDSDGTLILTMVENGTVVKKGDGLAGPDSSELESVAREEEIVLNQVRSARWAVQLTLETVQIAL